LGVQQSIGVDDMRNFIHTRATE